MVKLERGLGARKMEYLGYASVGLGEVSPVQRTSAQQAVVLPSLWCGCSCEKKFEKLSCISNLPPCQYIENPV